MLEAIKEVLMGEKFFPVAANLWNTIMTVIRDVLLLNPDSVGEGSAWEIITNIYPLFYTIASSLLVLFFVIGYCRENIDLRQPLTTERTITMFLRLIIANGVMAGILPAIPVVFRAATQLTELVIGKSYIPMAIPEITDGWDALGILSFFLGIATVFVAIGAGGILFFIVYMRFLKILMIVPFASIAMSTYAGGGTISQSGTAWIKTFLGYCFEIVVIAIALSLANAVVSGGSILPDGYDLAQQIQVAFNMIICMTITVGAVKGAESTLRRCLNL